MREEHVRGRVAHEGRVRAGEEGRRKEMREVHALQQARKLQYLRCCLCSAEMKCRAFQFGTR